MNETLQSILLFINQHTLLLIGICVFLILVLIGYLIDNSVKSKRVRRDIKNADQVPENIKEEIIEEAKKTKEFENAVYEPQTEEIKNESKENNVMAETLNQNTELNDSLNLDNTLVNDGVSDEVKEIFESNKNNLEEPLSLDLNLDEIGVQEEQKEVVEDPDINIMSDIINKPKEFGNDKRLSEILSQMDNSISYGLNSSLETETNNIFEPENTNIEFNSNVQKDDVQIETDDSSDELDRIMKKLSSMNNTEEDNYTNIF